MAIKLNRTSPKQNRNLVLVWEILILSEVLVQNWTRTKTKNAVFDQIRLILMFNRIEFGMIPSKQFLFVHYHKT